MRDKKVSVIGLGYIGLPTAALLASKDFKVYGVDINIDVINAIKKGKSHIVEPNLDLFLDAALEKGNLEVGTEPKNADIFIISVPTPIKANTLKKIENKSKCSPQPSYVCKKHKSVNFKTNIPCADLTYVFDAVKSILPVLKKGNIIIIESTVPVGTTEEIAQILKKYNLNPDDYYIGHCPERILPGNIMIELSINDRIVGGINKISTKKISDFYKSFVDGKIINTDAKTAELSKLTENSFRDLNIAFANELSLICDKYNIDVWELIRIANKHPRVNILNPGIGVGGHCIAVDPWFIIEQNEEHTKLLKSAREVNLYKTEWVIQKIINTILTFEAENVFSTKVACLGLSYKSDIDDLRESPALYIIQSLLKEEFDILPVEPNVDKIDSIELYSIEEALKESNIVVLLVGHKEFKQLDLKDKIVLDFCGVLNN